jgi:hypothetical protein
MAGSQRRLEKKVGDEHAGKARRVREQFSAEAKAQRMARMNFFAGLDSPQ